MRRINLLLAVVVCVSSLAAQSPPAPAPQLSPKAAYADAMQPLTTTRAEISNWSDTEIAALRVTISRAAKACAARRPAEFDGGDLIDLAKLCAVGQAWPAVVEATTRYITAKDAAKPLLGEAYAAQIDANLHLKNEPAALSGARAMLAAVPYNALTAQAVDEAVAYMQFAFTADAITLASLRQPLLLAALESAAAPPAVPTADATSTAEPATQSIHELYSDGLQLAALQQLAGSVAGAGQTVTALDAALPATLAPDDSLPIADARRRYALLGRALPDLEPTGYLRAHEPLPQLPAPNAITAFVVFPDWCAQCIRMGQAFPETVFSVAGHEAYLYGLLSETVPPAKSVGKDGFDPSYSSLLLAGTPTLVLAQSAVDRLSVDAVPFLLLTDASGIVRVAQSIDPTAIQPGGPIDTAIACVGQHWPLRSAAASPQAKALPTGHGAPPSTIR